MTLTIHTEENEQRELKLTIEVDEKRVKQEMKKMARKLARDINFPGFRRGRAPYHIVVSRVGREALRAETIEEMVQPVFEEAMEQIDEEVYGRSVLDDMEMEPFVIKLTLPLAPQVDLGDYRELRKEVEPVNVTDEAVDEALEQLQLRHQQVESVDRPAAAGDIVTLSGKGELIRVDDDADEDSEESEEVEDYDDVIFDEESVDLVMDADKLYLGALFVDEIVGLSVGDDKTLTSNFPEDFAEEELAGKEADFEISVLDVKERELPPLDDELAKLEGDYETLAELRDNLSKWLQKQAEAEAKNTLIEGMIDDMLEKATIVYPPAAVEAEVDSMVDEFKEQVTRAGWEWDDYVKLQGNSEESIRNNFNESAVEQLERQQILRQFILDEQLKVSSEDVNAAIEKRLDDFGDNEEFRESMRGYFQSGYGFDMVSSEVIMDKAHDRMTAILTGNAPDLEALKAAAEAVADEEE